MIGINDTPLYCPLDNNELKYLERSGLSIYTCSVCQGFFVKLNQLEAKAMESFLDGRVGQLGYSGAVVKAQNELVSPMSGEPMERLKVHDLELDYCASSHALWFDAGEYEKLCKLLPLSANSESFSGSISEYLQEAVVDHLAFETVGEVACGAAEIVGSFLGGLFSSLD